ncbi:unnamed protein product, partial [Phaeothamnion confervicola]
AAATVREPGGGRRLAAFQARYLTVQILCFFTDFLQGAYLYKVYQERGYDVGSMSLFFLGGIIASLAASFGIGTLVDRRGRRAGCVAFCALHAVQCCLLGSARFPVLLLGRALGGVAASLLNTSLECWLVTAHQARGLPTAALASTFSLSAIGLGGAAVVAGVVAGALVKQHGIMAPFYFASGMAIFTAAITLLLWEENYGGSASGSRGNGSGNANTKAEVATVKAGASLREAFRRIRTDRRVAALGAVQVLFESSLIVFVLLWAPTLLSAAGMADANLGLVYSMLMVAVMAGSGVFRVVTAVLPPRRCVSPEAVMAGAAFVGAISLGIVAAGAPPRGLLGAFASFEACLGAYFPAMGVTRSKVLGDDVRAVTMGIFRLALNALTALLLLSVVWPRWAKDLKRPLAFGTCAAFLAVAGV